MKTRFILAGFAVGCSAMAQTIQSHEPFIPTPNNAQLDLVSSNITVWATTEDLAGRSRLGTPTHVHRYYLSTNVWCAAQQVFQQSTNTWHRPRVIGVSTAGSLLFDDFSLILQQHDLSSLTASTPQHMFRRESRDFANYSISYPEPSGLFLLAVNATAPLYLAVRQQGLFPQSSGQGADIPLYFSAASPFWRHMTEGKVLSKQDMESIWPVIEINKSFITVWNGKAWTNTPWQ